MPNTSATGGYLTSTSTPPANDDGLEDIFQAAVVGVSGLTGAFVRPRFQPNNPKQPEASVNWCAFGVMETAPENNPYVEHDGTGQDNYRIHTDLRVLVTFYGPNAKGYAERTRDGFYIPQNREELALSLINFVSTDTIRQVPELVNNQWVKRYDLTMHFRRRIDRTYAILNIASADITASIDAVTVDINIDE